jgi:hypothetical protein
MLQRSLPVFLAVLALVCFVCLPGLADDKNAKVHEGKVVKAGDGKLTMTDKDGKNQHIHQVLATTKITCDGKECKLEDLKPGYNVKVTTTGDAAQTVTKIEATSKAGGASK